MVLRHHIVAFWTLAAALVISAVYQLYRSAFMEIPRYDAFTPTTGVVYASFIGVSALVLTARRWAWLVVSVLVVLLVLCAAARAVCAGVSPAASRRAEQSRHQ
jgi:hypothetical protein